MRGLVALFMIFLAGCSASGSSQGERSPPVRPATSIVGSTLAGTMQGALMAVQMPFEDLNLKRQPIPEKLERIADNPYFTPPQMLCEDLTEEIAELDALLGPDVCTPQNPTGAPLLPDPAPAQNAFVCTLSNPTGMVPGRGAYIEQGAGFAKEQAVGVISSKVDIIPFRGVVRKISGAEKHSRAVEKAYQSGRLRRAFLKGLAVSLGPDCVDSLSTIKISAPQANAH